jgi:hypothetical protein
MLNGMPQISAETMERALTKLRDGVTHADVAAVYQGDITPNDQDGATWAVFVTRWHRLRRRDPRDGRRFPGW